MSKVKIDVGVVVSLYAEKVKGFWHKVLYYCKSMFFDQYYVPIGKGKLEEIVKEWRKILENLHYVSEVFDCDDYASYFKAWATANYNVNAFAICLGEVRFLDVKGYHAWNGVLVNDNGKVKVIYFEPQLGEFFEKETTDKWEYKLWMVIV